MLKRATESGGGCGVGSVVQEDLQQEVKGF